MQQILRKLDTYAAIRAIRRGLINILPLLLIGSLSLALLHLPICFYQRFLSSFAGGFLLELLTGMNQLTYNMLSIALNIAITYQYTSSYTNKKSIMAAAILTSISVNLLFCGFFTEGFAASSLGAVGMFTALFSALSVSSSICFFLKRMPAFGRMYTMGADAQFNAVMSTILPCGLILLAAFLLNYAIVSIFQVNGFEALLNKTMVALFGIIKNHNIKTILFIILSSALWLFGLHGTNVLHSVELDLFSSASSSSVMTKEFIDLFVVMGGCGTTICLLLAILLFSKQNNNRQLARMATFPMLFNINEMMVFGLPVVFNTSFFIPFIGVPLLCTATSYIAVSTGLVPPPVHAVNWVTPVLAGGYIGTGSIAGSLLQLFNIATGTCIYRYFLIKSERGAQSRLREDIEELTEAVQEAEAAANTHVIHLLDLPGDAGGAARMLAADIKYALDTSSGIIEVQYQPQFHFSVTCVGVEALLRWNHPGYGYIYPPLIIEIAREAGLLDRLETYVFALVLSDIKTMKQRGLCPGKVSINITRDTLKKDSFVEFLRMQLKRHPYFKGILCIELTEQMNFFIDESETDFISKIRDMGISFAIDDFSIGHTSIRYLQNSNIDLVKLDGSLIRDMLENERSREIISSIMHMASIMKFKVMAEYVEKEEQRDLLTKLGCHYHQGFLYSKPLHLEALLSLLYDLEAS